MALRPNKDIAIIGAGLIGSLLAVVLQKQGYRVTVYERYLDIRSIPSLGRSINLVLTSRGLRALSSIGQNICNEVLELATPVTGRVLHQQDGTSTFQPYGKESECNWSISRFELNKYLLNKAEESGAKILFDAKVVAVDFDKLSVTYERAGQSQPSVIGGDLEEDTAKTNAQNMKNTRETVTVSRIIGADGGGSAVRYALRDAGHITFTEEFVEFGYKEMIFPKQSSVSMEPHGLHIWPRHEHFLMALVNKDGSFTGTIYVPRQGANSFATLTTTEAVTKFFNEHYAEAIPLLGGIHNVCESFLKNPIGLLGTVRTSKFNLGGRCLLIGDACHAIVPFFGQGTNCGFEDVLVLAGLFKQAKCEADFGALFEQFHQLRKPNADAIAELSLQNMKEMSDRVATKQFLLMKQIENHIESKHPNLFRSEYAMVCYGGEGNVTYHNARKLGKLQAAILQQLVEHVDSIDKVDMDHGLKLIRERLLPLQRKLGIDLTKVNHGDYPAKL